MRIGLDLDNTIACYDGLFHQIAHRRGLIPAGVATDKQAVRDFLRSEDRNDVWTELQGIVYGSAMSEAAPFAGAADFIRTATRHAWDVIVISHRTRRPYLGPPHDLHEAARKWLMLRGIVGAQAVRETNVFLEESLEAKLRRIETQCCDVFVDDLPELLLHPSFPPQIERICFDPAKRCGVAGLECVHAWSELTSRWFGGVDA